MRPHGAATTHRSTRVPSCAAPPPIRPAGRPKTTFSTILWFKLMIEFEGVHPLEGGGFRLKFRRDRRFGLPRESAVAFYTRYLWEILGKLTRYWAL